jgi:recombination associated protein RdgC
MWFRNLTVFRFEDTPKFEQPALESSLDGYRFTACDPQQMESMGWEPPLDDEAGQLVHAGSGFFLLTARREQRLLPATVVRDAVNRQVQDIERQEGRKVGRRQRTEIRDQLTFEMMPRAFTRSNPVQGMLMPECRALVVDAASRNRAEEWASLLRLTLGSLPVSPLAFKKPLTDVFTGWVSGKLPLPSGVELGDECVLVSPSREGQVVRCRKLNLAAGEVDAHIKAGLVVSRLAINWQGAMDFSLTDDGDIRKLQLQDTEIEQVEQEGVHDEAAEFDARFNLLGLELSRLLPSLWSALGGLAE